MHKWTNVGIATRVIMVFFSPMRYKPYAVWSVDTSHAWNFPYLFFFSSREGCVLCTVCTV